MRIIWLLPPLITARRIEVYCSSQNIRLRVRGPSSLLHCAWVGGGTLQCFCFVFKIIHHLSNPGQSRHLREILLREED